MSNILLKEDIDKFLERQKEKTKELYQGNLGKFETCKNEVNMLVDEIKKLDSNELQQIKDTYNYIQKRVKEFPIISNPLGSFLETETLMGLFGLYDDEFVFTPNDNENIECIKIKESEVVVYFVSTWSNKMVFTEDTFNQIEYIPQINFFGYKIPARAPVVKDYKIRFDLKLVEDMLTNMYEAIQIFITDFNKKLKQAISN